MKRGNHYNPKRFNIFLNRHFIHIISNNFPIIYFIFQVKRFLILFLRSRKRRAGGLASKGSAAPAGVALPQAVGKVASATFPKELHEIFTSISDEIVGKNFMRSVIFEAHVPENDGFLFDSVICG